MPPAWYCQRHSNDLGGFTYIISDDLTDLGRSGICNWQDLDQLGVLHSLGGGRREQRFQVDVPVGAEPNQTLYSDYCAAPDKGPFLASNMLIVQLLGKVVSEEDGPNDHKRPDISVQV